MHVGKVILIAAITVWALNAIGLTNPLGGLLGGLGGGGSASS